MNDMGLSSEVTYNIFDPVGVLVDAVGLPIDLMDVIGVFVDPRGVQGVHEVQAWHCFPDCFCSRSKVGDFTKPAKI